MQDMLVWNAVMLDRGFQQIVTGYPYGPVNLPLDGRLVAHEDGQPHFELCLPMRHSDPAADSASGAQCNTSRCVTQYATADSLGRFWFAHKAPGWWLRAAIKHVEATRVGSCGFS